MISWLTGRRNVMTRIRRLQLWKLKLLNWRRRSKDSKKGDIILNNPYLKSFFSNSNKDGKIKERDLTIEGLRAEISKLQANLSLFQNQKEIYEFQITVVLLNDLAICSKYSYWSVYKERSPTWLENLMPWPMPLLLSSTEALTLAADLPPWRRSWGSRLMCWGVSWPAREGRPTSIFPPWTQKFRVSMQIGKSYKGCITFLNWLIKLNRLKAELKILRKMYEEHMRVSQETLEMTYKKKVDTMKREKKT